MPQAIQIAIFVFTLHILSPSKAWILTNIIQESHKKSMCRFVLSFNISASINIEKSVCNILREN